MGWSVVPTHTSRILLFIGALLLCLPQVVSARLHHTIEASLDPGQHWIVVTDTITGIDPANPALEFTLHPLLKVETQTAGARLTPLSGVQTSALPALNRDVEHPGMVPVRYRAELPRGQDRLILKYQGSIRHDLQTQGEEYARGFRETDGVISNKGVFLSASSYWYPHVAGELFTYDLRLKLPAGWRGMTQGDRVERLSGATQEDEYWRCEQPQEEVYLIAGEFTEYQETRAGVQAMVLLREPDAALAQKYLDTTHDYLKLYAELIGPYPYGKFAMVENFWETGYGMPSFTLLGSRVIRFPFILHSSYPHEILHNWWGNSVYIDFARGNWAEGLTSYLADHLIKEQRGKGTGHRRDVLQKYTDYVRDQQDFPLTQFRSRHSSVTEAVGYGKTLMLFHMLRQRLGDAAFIAGLRELYKAHRFEVVDYAAVEAAFSRASGQSLGHFFRQWVERQGAPMLRVTQVRSRQEDGQYVLSAVIEQVQGDMPYELQVPVAVHLEDREQAWQSRVAVNKARTPIELVLPAAPLRLDVDPEFDVFRRLHRAEIPPAISQLFGAERTLIVLPARAEPTLLTAYRSLAEAWRAGKTKRVNIVLDNQIEQLPADQAVWLLGWRNRFRSMLADAVAGYAFADDGQQVRVGDTTLTSDTHSVVLLGRHPGNPDLALGWVATDTVAAVPGLGRKLPHYGRYSYLAFTGEAPDNVLKGQWPVVGSPLSVSLAGANVKPASLAERQPLARPREKYSASRMQQTIDYLAGPAMAGRGVGSAEIDQVAEDIVEQFRAAGLKPAGDDGGYLQVWQQTVTALGETATLKNVVGVLPGTDPKLAGESLVIGAHYDHFGRGEYADSASERGRVHPGADDNASGVAVMLELARSLAGQARPRSIIFVAFSGEELGRLGSRHYVQHARRYPVDKVIGMVNLDTVGRLGERALTVFGVDTADEWIHILRGAGYVTGVAVKPVAGDFGSSDQTSFIEASVPAIQLFSGAHADIHRPGDTPDKIDTAGLVKTARVLGEITSYLADRVEPLTTSLQSADHELHGRRTQGKRKVRLGTVPDYSFTGKGVLIDDIHDGTPAEQAGLRKGDIILTVNDQQITSLRDYAEVLRQLKPDEEIRLRYHRDGEERQVTTRVMLR